MATNEELGLPTKGTYPAKVIEVIDDFKVVINRIPETEKILDTILEKWLLYKMEYVYGVKRNTNYD